MQLAYRHGERPGESYEALDGKKVDVFISVFGMVSAELMQFHYCNHFLWAICCRMVHSNLNLMSETDVLVETPELVFNICHSHHYS